MGRSVDKKTQESSLTAPTCVFTLLVQDSNHLCKPAVLTILDLTCQASL